MKELFGKKHETNTIEKSEEEILKEGLEEEVEKLQNRFRAQQEEIEESEKKLLSVKEEYESTVSSLMEIKKETNQKNLELDVVKREYRDIKQRIETTVEKEQKNKELINELNKNETNLKIAKDQLKILLKKENDISGKISQAQSTLHDIKSQEITARHNLQEPKSNSDKTKTESMNLKKKFIFSNRENEFIKDQIDTQQHTKGIVEAAGVITASLKSKLTIAQKELETVEKLLEKERKEHRITKEMLDKLQSKNSKNKS